MKKCPVCNEEMPYDPSGFWTCDRDGHTVTIDTPPAPEMPEEIWVTNLAWYRAPIGLAEKFTRTDTIERDWIAKASMTEDLAEYLQTGRDIDKVLFEEPAYPPDHDRRKGERRGTGVRSTGVQPHSRRGIDRRKQPKYYGDGFEPIYGDRRDEKAERERFTSAKEIER